MSVATTTLEVLVLGYVAWTDIATRLIPNEACIAIALFGLAAQGLGQTHVLESLVATGAMFLLLLFIYGRGWIGGGDVKLLGALAIGFPISADVQMLPITALAGGGLALGHMILRRLPSPKPAPIGSSALRRAVAVERWRNLRRAPLPYGAAIACGGVWTLLNHGC